MSTCTCLNIWCAIGALVTAMQCYMWHVASYIGARQRVLTHCLLPVVFVYAQLLREMQEKKLTVSAVTYVAVIDAVLCSEDQLDTALDLYSEMKQVCVFLYLLFTTVSYVVSNTKQCCHRRK
jgi:hypothetical protein